MLMIIPIHLPGKMPSRIFRTGTNGVATTSFWNISLSTWPWSLSTISISLVLTASANKMNIYVTRASFYRCPLLEVCHILLDLISCVPQTTKYRFSLRPRRLKLFKNYYSKIYIDLNLFKWIGENFFQFIVLF